MSLWTSTPTTRVAVALVAEERRQVDELEALRSELGGRQPPRVGRQCPLAAEPRTPGRADGGVKASADASIVVVARRVVADHEHALDRIRQPLQPVRCPWTCVSNAGSGFGAKSRGPGVLVVRNTVVTSGWRPSHSATWIFQARTARSTVRAAPAGPW